MTPNEMIGMNIRLPFAAARALILQCEREYILPRQAMARAVGARFDEPVMFQIPALHMSREYPDLKSLNNRAVEWRPLGDQKKFYLLILSQLAIALPDKFSEIAPTLKGNKRRYFARIRSEVEGTGRSNKADRIPDTDWYASTNHSANQKHTNLRNLMRPLGFSYEYRDMIGWAPTHKYPCFDGVRFEE